MFANTDSTAKDVKKLMELRKDGTKPVEVDRRPYQPKLDLVYEEPEYYPEDDELEILYWESGAHCIEIKRHCHHVMILFFSVLINRVNLTITYSGAIVRKSTAATFWKLSRNFGTYSTTQE